MTSQPPEVPAAPRSAPRRLLLGAVTAAALASLAIALLEILVRVLGIASPPRAVSLDRAGFDALPGVHFPAPVATDRSVRALPFRVGINALGFRGPEVAREKPDGERRIVLLGDSFAWGQFVDDSATLPLRVEQRLSAACRNTRVLNFALPGSSIDAQRALLTRARSLSPDAIVLVHHDNDVVDLRSPTFWEQLAAAREAKSRLPMRVVYPLLRRMALWSVIRDARTRLGAVERRRRADAPMSQHDLPDIEALKARYAIELAALSAAAESLAVPLFLTAYPSHNALADPQRTTFGWFVDLVQARADRYVDLHGPLRASGLPDTALYLLPVDGHASARGYALAAGPIAQALLTAPEALRYCEPR